MKKFGLILLILVLTVSLLLPVFGGALGEGQALLTVSAQAEEYEEYEEYEEDSGGGFAGVLICFVIALLIALLVIGILKGQLKSVETKTQADQYMGPGALNLTVREDVYTHTTTTRTYDPEDKDKSDN